MSAASRYIFSSCLRTFHGGYWLFSFVTIDHEALQQ